jgi:hypothetical protein
MLGGTSRKKLAATYRDVQALSRAADETLLAQLRSAEQAVGMDAHETSMSNSSDALVGAAGMMLRKRGLEITAGAGIDVYTPSTSSGFWSSGTGPAVAGSPRRRARSGSSARWLRPRCAWAERKTG